VCMCVCVWNSNILSRISELKSVNEMDPKYLSWWRVRTWQVSVEISQKSALHLLYTAHSVADWLLRMFTWRVMPFSLMTRQNWWKFSKSQLNQTFVFVFCSTWSSEKTVAKVYFSQHTQCTIDKMHTLQHTATHCNTLQHTATHCNTLQQYME